RGLLRRLRHAFAPHDEVGRVARRLRWLIALRRRQRAPLGVEGQLARGIEHWVEVAALFWPPARNRAERTAQRRAHGSTSNGLLEDLVPRIQRRISPVDDGAVLRHLLRTALQELLPGLDGRAGGDAPGGAAL